MVDFAAISKGFNERQDYNRNKRLEVMELFEQFKRNNPEATMADFQSFRDQVSGGRNYLRGGVGNDAALKRIVDTNEQTINQTMWTTSANCNCLRVTNSCQALDVNRRLEVHTSRCLNAPSTTANCVTSLSLTRATSIFRLSRMSAR